MNELTLIPKEEGGQSTHDTSASQIAGRLLILRPIRAALPMIFITAVLLAGCTSQSKNPSCDYNQFTADNIDQVFIKCNNTNIDFNKLHKICDKEWDKYPTFEAQYSRYMSCVNKLVYTNQ